MRYLNILPTIATCLCSIFVFMPNISYAAVIGYWEFNENIGNVVNDASGLNNHGTVIGAAWFSDATGISLDFTGNGYVEILDSVSLDVGQDYSVSLWVNPGILPTWQCLFERGISADNRMGIWLNGDQITFETSNNGGNWWTTSSTVTLNQWHHIVVTHDGASDTENVYVNGSLIGSEAGRTVDTPNLGSLYIGYSPAYSGYNFNGKISDVRFFDNTLNDSEIFELFTGEPPVCTDNDGDGFNAELSMCGPVDCNDNDPSINPGAEDLACDGIDQSCSGQDFCPSDPDSPLAYFLLDSNANDSSGNGNNGSVVGAEIYAPGQIDDAFSFDGNSYVNVPSSVNLDVGESYSISLWANPGSLPTWQCLFERGISADNRMGIWFNGDQITFETSNNGGSWWTTPSVVAASQWQHIVATHDGTSDIENIYVNGALVGSQIGRTVDNPNLGDLHIGSSPAYSAGYKYNGKLDDARLFNKVLNQADVSELYLSCSILDTRICGASDLGQCTFGVQSCAGGQWGLCEGSIDPVVEACGDGLDNDCDGRSDCDDSDCFGSLICADNPYQINYVSPTPADGATQQENSVTVHVTLTGSGKYAFVDWNDGVNLWLTMDADINGKLLDFSSKNRSIETKGNVSQITGKFGSAMRFDGYEDYLQIYEEIDPANSVAKYANNPLIVDGARFGSVWKDAQKIYLFYSKGTEVYVSSSSVSDGLTFSGETKILGAGNPGAYDDVISGANVWEENGTWHMFYRLRTSDNNNGFGYANCNAGISCVTGTGFWDKYSGNPIDSVEGLENNDYDPFGLIKVGNTYHLYANPSPRVINHYTSDDLINWQSDSNNPIFNTDRYCPYVFKHNAYYYMFLPHDLQGFETSSGIVGDHSFELYRDTSPTFYSWEREYLGVVMSNDETYDQFYIDTPSCVLDTIERDSSLLTEPLKCYYTGNSGVWNQNFMSVDLAKLNSLPVLPEGFLQGEKRTISGWIYLEDNQTSRSIFSIGDGKIDSNFQEVFRVFQGKPAISWKTGVSGEDTLLGDATIPLNKWTHVSYVYDGGSFRIYVNGISDSLWKAGTPYYQKRNLYLGSGYDSGDYFQGGLDDVLIFNRVLTDDEIFALYDAGANLISQFNSLTNGTYSYQAQVVGWEGRKASSEKRQITVSAP